MATAHFLKNPPFFARQDASGTAPQVTALVSLDVVRSAEASSQFSVELELAGRGVHREL